MRELQPGLYVLEQGEQLPGESKVQHRYAWEPQQEVECVHRGAGPVITVPPGKVWVVDLRLRKPVEVPALAPDLAIMPRDIRRTGDNLTVTVHNIGSGDAGPFVVLLESGAAGSRRELTQAEVDGLAGSRDLLPSVRTVSVNVPPGGLPGDTHMRLRLEPDAYEACLSNNSVRLK